MMNESTFEIEIEETLLRIIEIQASSFEEALSKAKKKYYNEEIVLDYSDHYDTKFSGALYPPTAAGEDYE